MKPLGSRVDPAPNPLATPVPGAVKALPQQLPGGWTIAGGPADYDAKAAATALGDEAGRFRGLQSYAAAEYANSAQRVIALETFAMVTTTSARNALSLGKPKESRAIEGEDVDEGFIGGLRAEARRGAFLARVRWFEAEDPNLEEAAIDALRDVIAAGEKEGLAIPPPSPVPTPP